MPVFTYFGTLKKGYQVSRKNNSIFSVLKKFAPFLLYVSPVGLVAYFILHENNAYFGLIPLSVSLKTALYYSIFLAISSVCCYYIFNSAAKTSVYTTLLLGIAVFFGSAQDFLRTFSFPVFVTRYRFLLCAVVALLAGVFILLKRSRAKLDRLCKANQVAIAILVVWELVALAGNALFHKAQKNIVYVNTSADAFTNTTPLAQAPNIYFIVFDAFTSSRCLKEEFNYNNAELDSFFTQRGFYLVNHSKSNYAVTPYSIASTLNLSYLDSTLYHPVLTVQDLLKGTQTVAQNRLVPYLEKRGYAIYNYSVFDIDHHPVHNRTFFHDMPGSVLNEQTLVGRVQKDILWNFSGNQSFTQARAHHLQDYVYGNMDGLQTVLSQKATKPRFVYCHIALPHDPYYFNKDGTFKSREVFNATPAVPKKEYLHQLIYTRQLVRSAIRSIQKKDTSNKIIVVEGDHGFREYRDPGKIGRYFDNLNAIYFYDKNYAALYDSITPVNTFRVVLRQYFNEPLPLLPDASIYVDDPFFDKPAVKKQ